MYIKSMTLHGFKSYGVKTTINNFDPQFNAITGLNGCGKSNILDAICFVLCQASPTKFRVDSMADLVYKKGAGGISFASVSITFDNRNKDHSPPNYRQFPEIEVERKLVQGKSNYTINGTKVNQNIVQDFFRSVQLNIDSAHFLIMQGRITKVLAMKPEEIWAMVEEAAGTMMYINKRNATQKLISDKDKRVQETDTLLESNIKPTIERLEKDRRDEIDRQKLNRQCEKLQSQVAAKTAYDYKMNAVNLKQEREKLKLKEKELQAALEDLDGQVVAMNERIHTLESGDSDQSAALKVLEAAAAECRKKVLAIQSEIDSNRNLIEEEEKLIADCEREVAAKKAELEELAKHQEKIHGDLAAAEAKKTELDGQVLRAQQAVAVIVTGVGGRDNADFGWKNQCTAAQGNLNEVDRRVNIVKGTLTNLRKSAVTAQESAAKAKTHEKVLQTMRTLEEEIAGMKGQRESALQGGDMDGLNALRQEQRALLGQKAALEQQISGLEQRLRNLEVPLKPGFQQFDRRKVYGAVGKLFTVKDPERFVTALDVAAGGQKFQFVVEDDETAKVLLGGVTRRITLVPISRARGRRLSNDQVQRIQRKVGPNKAWPAIDLVSYDEKFRSIAEYAFGTTMICVDLDTANAIAFDRSSGEKIPCVTLVGDSVNPDGLVTGGQHPVKENTTLYQAGKCSALIAEYDRLKVQLTEKATQLAEFERRDTELQKLDQDIHQKTSQLNAMMHECDRNQGLRNLMDAERIKREIETLETELAQLEVRRGKLQTTIAELKVKLSAENAADVEKQEAERNEAKCREAVQKQTEAVNKVVRRQVEGQMDLDNNRLTTENLLQEVQEHRKRIVEYEQKIGRKQETLAPVEADYAKADKKYADKRSGVAQKSVELQEAQADKRKIEKDKAKAKRDHDQAKTDMAAKKDQLRNIEKKLNEELFQQFPWLGDEYDKLGTPESTYKVEEMSLHALKEELEKNNKRRKELQRAIGNDNNFDFENIQKQYQDLLEKTKTCQSDKLQLEQIIKNLDLKKQELIEGAVEQVNKRFGRIFSSFLPNANCKLEREKNEKGKPVEALRIRVALGTGREQKEWMWKESLVELSGGQRSLVALSLILAMLKMNPAPVYILDEIDAALDLSHTQNVGKMIRRNFKESQFVIVSLKEGMFNNANIVFKVGFQDGVSKITSKVRDRSNEEDDEMDDDEDAD